jgi:hypothetical protein
VTLTRHYCAKCVRAFEGDKATVIHGCMHLYQSYVGAHTQALTHLFSPCVRAASNTSPHGPRLFLCIAYTTTDSEPIHVSFSPLLDNAYFCECDLLHAHVWSSCLAVGTAVIVSEMNNIFDIVKVSFRCPCMFDKSVCCSQTGREGRGGEVATFLLITFYAFFPPSITISYN